MRSPLLVAFLAACASPPAMVFEDAALRAELLQRSHRDQELRKRMDTPDKEQQQRVAHECDAVDRDNTTWLQGVVAARGWPTRTMAGEDGAHAAWLMLQHADHDRDFQARMLPRLQELAQQGEADPSDAAYLTDRVLNARGEPQVYGTQYPGLPKGGSMQYLPPRVVDPARLDQRRQAMGLGPWREYEAIMARIQGREPFAAPRGPSDP